jgi:CRISPR-associated exonuclease Cas4
MLEVDERQVFTVTDLKQYEYCPRIIAYTYCLPLMRPTTYKMEAGIAAHERAEKHERRRTLAAYGLRDGKRRFDVWLESPILGLRGRLDMLIEVDSEEGCELIPVEYKQTRRRVGRHIQRQLAAYGMMVEETRPGTVRRGFVYSLLKRRAEEVPISRRLQEEVRATVAEMREVVEREAMPDPPRSRRGCVNCEFRRFCNDVL